MFRNLKLTERLYPLFSFSSKCRNRTLQQVARLQMTLTSPEKNSNEKKPKRIPKANKKVENYFSQKTNYDFIKNHFPSNLLQLKITTPDSIYLTNEQIAQEIVSLIGDDLKGQDSHIIEANPGVGFLTRELLKIGLPKIQLFEPLDCFLDVLQNIQNENPSKVILKKFNIFQISKIDFLDKLDNGNRLQEAFDGITPKSWSDDPVMKIIGFLPNRRFIGHILKTFQYNTGFSSFGRLELYLVMTPYLFKLLTSSPDDGYLLYRSESILFQMIYDFKLIAKFPRKEFLPWQNITIKSTTKLKKFKLNEKDTVYLLKCVPKKNFFDQFENPIMIRDLGHFIHYHYRKRSSRVIPKLENWIPGCGTRLIHEGYTIYTEFGELHIDEIMKLFKTFYNWPEYPYSNFIPSMESYLKGTTLDVDPADFDIHNEEYIDEDEDENEEI